MLKIVFMKGSWDSKYRFAKSFEGELKFHWQKTGGRHNKA